MRAAPASRRRVVIAIGLAQLLAWASSYYLLAIVATPMAASLGLPNVAVFGAFSLAWLTGAALGPAVGARIDRYGGRAVLLASNAVFALGLSVLALAQGPVTLVLGWLLIGTAMPMGLYDAAFSTLVGLYRADARRSIVGVTLIAGFASSVGWPLSAALEAHYGWRATCAVWALLHLLVGATIHFRLVPRGRAPQLQGHAEAAAPAPALPKPAVLMLLAAVFACSGFVFAAMAAHLPRVLQAAGSTPAAAVAAAALVGASQVAARLAEAGFLGRLHPLVSARISTALHPLGALLLGVFGAPFAAAFSMLHGAGMGLMTIVKGTLPLALFGAAGFGRRAGLLEAPSRVAQAAAPLVFGLWLDRYGDAVLWISGGIAFAGFVGVLVVGYLTRPR